MSKEKLSYEEQREIKHKHQKQLLMLERNELLQEYIEDLEKAKIWINAKEGERIGHGNYYVMLKSLVLGSAFMGYGTGGSIEMKFPASRMGNIFGDMQIIGDMKMTSKLADALIDLFRSELVELDSEQPTKGKEGE